MPNWGYEKSCQFHVVGCNLWVISCVIISALGL